MDKNAFREQLAKLHAELHDAHQENPAERRSLGEILPDVKRMVESSSLPDASSSDTSLPERLEGVAVQFEAEHPTLAASTRRLIDLLSKAGI
jgi:hypothetical protein